jgi:hypothetical protein
MYRVLAAIGLVTATLVSGAPVRAQASDQAIPPNLAVPGGNVLLLETPARGVQIYGCQPTADNPTVLAWTLRAPEAELMNRRGERIGTHYAGPTWEGNDGSQVVGAARETANSPDPQAIPWLLLEARSNQGSGVFSAATYIQRLDTVGGRAPATGCDQAHQGEELRVDYTATYAFYYPGAP